ncbi:MAG: glycerol-3-phosphate 1-O-acyltransferase PlsY [Bacteroidales bacterium]
MLNIFIAIVLAYFLGSIPTAVWVGHWMYHIDIRNHGSHNAGATNTLRVLGPKAGIPVLLFDVFKGWLAVSLASWLCWETLQGSSKELFLIAAGVAAVLGHVFPLFAGFRGGKGVATLLGMGIALFPWPALAAVGVFTLMMLLFRIVSLASITAGITFPLWVFFLPYQPRPNLPLLLLSLLVAVFIPLTHRSNILRLLKGQEKKLTIASRPQQNNEKHQKP